MYKGYMFMYETHCYANLKLHLLMTYIYTQMVSLIYQFKYLHLIFRTYLYSLIQYFMPSLYWRVHLKVYHQSTYVPKIGFCSLTLFSFASTKCYKTFKNTMLNTTKQSSTLKLGDVSFIILSYAPL